MELEAFSGNCSLAEEDGRVGALGKYGHYGEAVSDERANKGFVGAD